MHVRRPSDLVYLPSQRVHERSLRRGAAVQHSAKRKVYRDQHADRIRGERDVQRRQL